MTALRLVIGAVLAFIPLTIVDVGVYVCYRPLAAEAPPLEASQKCLANALWHEARGEPLEGQRAVLDVIYNRAVQSNTSVCQVVTASQQFSWYEGKLKPLNDSLVKLLENVKNHARVLSHKYTHFYSGPKPYWAKGMECTKVGNQTFCKEKNVSKHL
jgi:hypothetical protein